MGGGGGIVGAQRLDRDPDTNPHTAVAICKEVLNPHSPQSPSKKRVPGYRGGGGGTRPWWLALLARGGAYWPLSFEPSTGGGGGGTEVKIEKSY